VTINTDTVVVDVDQSGFVANGKTYEMDQEAWSSSLHTQTIKK